jgi:hypothetical protein
VLPVQLDVLLSVAGPAGCTAECCRSSWLLHELASCSLSEHATSNKTPWGCITQPTGLAYWSSLRCIMVQIRQLEPCFYGIRPWVCFGSRPGMFSMPVFNACIQCLYSMPAGPKGAERMASLPGLHSWSYVCISCMPYHFAQQSCKFGTYMSATFFGGC